MRVCVVMGGRDTGRNLCHRRRPHRQVAFGRPRRRDAGVDSPAARAGGRSGGRRLSRRWLWGWAVTRELARLAGPSGLAVGVDFDSDVLALAEEDAARLGVTNVLFRCGDALGLASAVGDFDFDVVYCRFLLSHVVSPGDVVREMADLVRPGGAVAVEDIDYRGSLCEPPSEAFQRYDELYQSTFDCGAPTPRSGPAFQVCSMTPGWWMSTSPAFNSSGAIHNRLSNGSTS